MALYRQYRPASFETVVGQEAAVEALKANLESNKLGHATLLSGPHGIGKTTLARLVAQSLTCAEAPTYSPCGECDSCKAFTEGAHPDLLEMDAASNRGVDDARAIRERLTIAPMMSGNTVLIIDEAHMLTREAQNALLKTLEEPPQGAYFIFATTAPDKLLPTIRSRCQNYMLKPPSGAELEQALVRVIEAEGIECDQEALLSICAAAAGSYRDGLSLLDQAASGGKTVTKQAVQQASGLPGTEAWGRICAAIGEGDGVRGMEVVQQLISEGFDIRSALSGFERFLRLALYAQAGGIPEALGASQEEIEAATAAAQVMTPPALWGVVRGIEAAYQTAAFGGSAALAVESSIAQAASGAHLVPRQSLSAPEAESGLKAQRPIPQREEKESEDRPPLQTPTETDEHTAGEEVPSEAADHAAEAERGEESIPAAAGQQGEPTEQPFPEEDLPGPAVAAEAFPLLKLALRSSYPAEYIALRTAWGRYDDRRLVVQTEKPMDQQQAAQALAVLKRMVDGSVIIATRKPHADRKAKRQSRVEAAQDPTALLASMGFTPLEGERRSDQEQGSKDNIGADPGEG